MGLRGGWTGSTELLYSMLFEVVRSMPNYQQLKTRAAEIVAAHPRTDASRLHEILRIPRGVALILLRAVKLWYYEVPDEVRLCRHVLPKYRKAGVGGTFDRLHVGHLALLNTAFREAEKVYIGLVSDEFARSSGKSDTLSYDERRSTLEEELRRWGWIDRAEIGELNDPYGPPLTDESFDVVIGSPFTLTNCMKIAVGRIAASRQPIAVEVGPVVLAEDGSPISSTRIRAGEVDRSGRLTRPRGGPSQQPR
ncbi:MAG: pantetheine-phosphate adenylyltransferase [Thaumarchaeota archaeon]|nr:pantetheine-phosphate adenylyltransferase [Candidatus Calditenuaceae archaeon]MDW8042430.1 pantetheine-phosphate adenylyltransferase [Nitrososphaerota archaeon]